MNLHGIAGPIIGAVNPNRTITLRRSVGVTTMPNGRRDPVYDDVSGLAQIQALMSEDLQHLSEQNQQKQSRSVYLYGQWFGVVRVDQKGGDMLLFDNKTWLVVANPEVWSDWSRVIVCLQSQ